MLEGENTDFSRERGIWLTDTRGMKHRSENSRKLCFVVVMFE